MKDNLSYIALVMDMSGSMAAIRDGAIIGFNEFLKGQQADPNPASFKLIMFDDKYEVRQEWVEISKVAPLTWDTFVPRGSTALLDAIGRTIVETGDHLTDMPEAERPGHVIIAILTDGQENASRLYNQDLVVEMMERQKDFYKWQFLFLASDIHTQQSAVALAAGPENNLAFAATNVGTQSAFATTTSNVTRMRNS